MSFTAQNVIDLVNQDLQVGAQNTSQYLEFVNRTQEEILRFSNWKFLEKPLQSFITEKGQTDYWIGATGSAPAGTVDTGLNLTDLGRIKEGEVFDRSNFRALLRTSQQPLLARLGYQDATSRLGRPAQWRNDPDTPNVINIYPAPDNQNTYQPVPPVPYVVYASGGALAARTYWVVTTLVDTLGNESAQSTEQAVEFIAANNLATVKSPAPEVTAGASGIKYDRYNVYAYGTTGTTELDEAPGTLTLQNNSPVSVGTDWTEANTGLTTNGASAPTTNNLVAMKGYVIQFKYYATRQPVTSTSQTLQVIDDYRDVFCAGVAWRAAVYLRRMDEAVNWKATYASGIRDMIRDKNLFPKDNSFVSPDGATLTRQLPSIESLDVTRFLLP